MGKIAVLNRIGKLRDLLDNIEHETNNNRPKTAFMLGGDLEYKMADLYDALWKAEPKGSE